MKIFLLVVSVVLMTGCARPELLPPDVSGNLEPINTNQGVSHVAP